MPDVRSLSRLFCTTGIALACAAGPVFAAAAQTPAGAAAPRPATPAAPAGAPKINATMLQLMRGIVYPASNVVFAAQDDLSKQPAAADPATSPNPLTSTYGGWVAVEN